MDSRVLAFDYPSLFPFRLMGSLSHAPFVCGNHEALWLDVSVNKDSRAAMAEAVPELQPYRSGAALPAGNTWHGLRLSMFYCCLCGAVGRAWVQL